MGKRKNDKKRRRRERQRLLQLQGNQVDVGTPSSVAASCGSNMSLNTPSSAVKHDAPASRLQRKEGNSLFGSVVSRKRALPQISFVYPRQNGRRLPFHFRNEEENGGSAGNEKCTPLNGTNEQFSSDSPSKKQKINQSIDDILYPNAVEVAQRQLRPSPSNVENRTLQSESADSREMLQSKAPSHKETPISTAIPQSSCSDTHKHHNLDRPASSPRNNHAHAVQSPHPLRDNYLSGVSVEEAVRDKVGLRPRSNSTDGELNLPQRGLCDERKVLENYQWRQNISKGPPKGLNNLGNSCYLNSTLQCLAYCPPFCQSLMSMQSRQQQQQPNESQYNSPSLFAGSNKKKNQGKKITLMLSALFRQVHSTENGHSNGSGRSISPRSIVQAVPTLGSCGSHRNGYKFRPGRQEDAHEFLVHLLDAMNDGELREAGIDPRKSGWRDRLPVSRLDETTFVHRIFGGYLRSQVRCTVCGYRSNTYDPFLDLSLEISRKSCHSVATALQEFTRKETLDSENRWKCSGCKKRVCATKKLTVFRPPLSLCIQLKRFSFGGSFGGFGGGFGGFGGGGKKISKPVNFPAHLELPLSDKRSCGYSLTGIVIHIGGSASSGHYTACVKKPGKNGEDRWFHVDDSFVQAVSEQDVLRQRDAYMLLYCRKEVKLEFPSPPLRGSMSADEAKEFGRARARARADSITESNDGALKRDVASVGQIAALAEAKAEPALSSNESSVSHGTDTTKHVFIGPLPAPSHRPKNLFVDSKSMKPPQKMARLCESPIPDINTSPPPSPAGDEMENSLVDGAKERVENKRRNKVDQPDRLVDKRVNIALDSKSSLEDSSANEDMQTSILPRNDPSSAERRNSASDESSSSGESSDSGSSSSEESSESESTSSAAEESSTALDAPFAKSTSGADDDSSYEPTPTRAQSSLGDRKAGKQNVTRITMDRGRGGKVEVMMGPHYKAKKSWKPKTVVGPKDDGFDLLGNLRVSKWEDGEDQDGSDVRAKLAKQMDQNEKQRKRKMFLDRHDALLDQGKTKKVKNKNSELAQAPRTPSSNEFQRIQASVQRMNKGRAKGFVRNQVHSGKRRL